MIRRSGIELLVALLVVSLGGCLYGFAGGGLPSNIHTVAVLPFDNETSASGLGRELHDRMRREIEGRLGLKEAAEGNADALVRGRIVSYDPDIPAAYSADQQVVTTARRRLRIAIDVEIVDQANGRVLWSRKGLTAEGEYGESSEDEGREQAIEKLVSDIVAGAQSQW
ncbi:MAG TPA: LptE family protein [Gemmatimonadaceae bacterium]|nr:LptE family protein [Gemmatimonadaceae bacterium]